MAMLMHFKDVLRCECLLAHSKRYPELDPSAMEAFLHLASTGFNLLAVFGQYFERYNISHGRFMVLALLSQNADGSANPADLAERSGVTRATMTGLIDTLERDGLVKREPDPKDRRMMLVGLTARGRALLEGILPDYFRRVSALMACTTDADRKNLVVMMTKLQRRIPEVVA